MKQYKIALIGSGYIGRCHAIAYAQAPTLFNLKAKIKLECLVEANKELAKSRSLELGFARFSDNWQEIVNDPNIDIIDICTPNFLHKDIAMAAIKAGKIVYCEKPLALSAAESQELYLAAKKHNTKTIMGFNYLKNPTTQLAKEIINNGEIGDIIHFYGTHNEDYLANNTTPIDWHCIRNKAGSGALGDLGSHIISVARYLVQQEITTVVAETQTIIKERPNPLNSTELLKVENEDQASAIFKFANGITGVLETSRIASGRKMGLTYVITGTKGTISFTQERMSELKLYLNSDDPKRQGFKTILTGPLHPDYKNFCISASHGIGFNDQKAVEIRDLINGISGDEHLLYPNFYDGYKIACIVEAIEESAKTKQWISI